MYHVKYKRPPKFIRLLITKFCIRKYNDDMRPKVASFNTVLPYNSSFPSKDPRVTPQPFGTTYSPQIDVLPYDHKDKHYWEIGTGYVIKIEDKDILRAIGKDVHLDGNISDLTICDVKLARKRGLLASYSPVIY
jgi:hypothetical protein